MLADVGPGDEVIMPSYTFVSTANAFVLRGATPVFVDIRPDTLNIDEALIEAAITPRTRAIVPVHYAGVACEMDAIMDIAERHGLLVIEDAAQGMMSTYKGRPLGTHRRTWRRSRFHETKNIISGEGGALLVNDPRFVRAGRDHPREGHQPQPVLPRPGRQVHLGRRWARPTCRARSSRPSSGRSWRRPTTSRAGASTSGAPTTQRLAAVRGRAADIRLPVVPAECDHNAHMYYVVLPDARRRAPRSSTA